MEPEEPARRHEGEREQEHPGVVPPIGCLARRVAEHEGKRTDEAEHEKVEPVVLEVRIEARLEE